RCAASWIVEPPRKCGMLTPRFQPSRLTSMKSDAAPWNHVAVMRPSSCHTVRKRSQSPASRHTAQFSMTSRIASLSPVMSTVCSPLFTRVPDVAEFVELDVDERTTGLFHTSNVDGLHDVARLGIDHDRAAWARQFHTFECRHQSLGIR